MIRSGKTVYEQTACTTGFREIRWPKIVEPDKDHNVRSIRTDQQIVDLGDTPPSAQNNGHTGHLLDVIDL